MSSVKTMLIFIGLSLFWTSVCQGEPFYTLNEVIINNDIKDTASIRFFIDFSKNRAYTKEQIDEEISCLQQRLDNSLYFFSVNIFPEFDDELRTFDMYVETLQNLPLQIRSDEETIGIKLKNWNNLGIDYQVFLGDLSGLSIEKKELFYSNDFINAQVNYRFNSNSTPSDFNLNSQEKGYELGLEYGQRWGWSKGALLLGYQTDERTLFTKFKYHYNDTDSIYCPKKGSTIASFLKLTDKGWINPDISGTSYALLFPQVIWANSFHIGWQMGTVPSAELYSDPYSNGQKQTSIVTSIRYELDEVSNSFFYGKPFIYVFQKFSSTSSFTWEDHFKTINSFYGIGINTSSPIYDLVFDFSYTQLRDFGEIRLSMGLFN